MARILKIAAAILVAAPGVAAQSDSDAMSKVMAQGELFESKHQYELALEAYHKADKLAHHESAHCYLRLAAVERKLGDFSAALDDTKKAIKAAGNDKNTAVQAYMMRATLLVRLSGKPSDKKLKEAEEDMRQAIALDSQQALAHFNLGTILMKQERDADGIAELNEALALPGLAEKTAGEARKFIASPIRAREPFAPDFDFVTKENQRVSNSKLRGRVVLLDFWGTWCPPCRESVPTMKNVRKKFAGKGFELIGISSDDDEEVWRTFVEAKQMDWQEYIDLSGEVQEAFNIDSFPTYIVLDKDGVIRFRQSGFGVTTEGELEDAIGRALKKNSDPTLANAAAAGGVAKKEAEALPATVKTRNEDAEKFPLDSAEDELSGIEAGAVTGNIYRNDRLSLTYEFPKGWTAASSESIHSINSKAEAAAKASMLQQHPEMADHLSLTMPKTIFYASKKGQGNPQQLSLPCVKITATPSQASTISLETFQSMADNMAAASGAKLLGPASKFEVQRHTFVRVDFERSLGGIRVYQAYAHTHSESYRLTIEIYAGSAEELQQIAETLETMVIRHQE